MTSLTEMRLDSATKQKKGLHFILGSVILWTAVLFVHLTALPIETKNLLTFVFTTPLLPLAFFISKLIRVDFSNKDNPLTSLGLLFSMNQMLYLLIAMWVYAAVPDKMVMILAMIFGAHLLPYGWLYQSRAYMVMAVVIPLAALAVGLLLPPYMVPAVMVVFELVFSALLIFEVRALPAAKQPQRP